MTKIVEKIAELDGLEAKATKGPWKTDAYYIVAEVPTGRPGGEVIIACRPTVQRLLGHLPHKDTAVFIAALRNAWPALREMALRAAPMETVRVPREPTPADWARIQDACNEDCAMSIVSELANKECTWEQAADRICAYAIAAFKTAQVSAAPTAAPEGELVRVPRNELLGALARGYCAIGTDKEVLNPHLISAMADEVEALLAAALDKKA